MEEGALLLDVRSPGEFSGGHVSKAVNIPVDSLQAKVASLDKKRAVVVYCQSGMRSSNAARILRSHGVASVHDMGAMRNWEGGINVQRYAMLFLFCMLLGLAPFSPEPHIVGKLRWVAGGAVGMGLMDWGDLLMHGAPWGLLVLAALSDARDWLTTRAG